MTLPDPIDDPQNSVDLHVQATYRLTEALVDAEERMRRRINMLSEVVFETDSEDNFVFLNHAWQTITGHPQKASLNQGLLEVCPSKDGRPHSSALSCVGTAPQSWDPSSQRQPPQPI